MKENILFVCKYNRFRSKVAEAYFNKINKNRNITAKSLGIIKGNPISKDAKIAAKKYGLNIGGEPKTLSSKLLSKTNRIIIVADDVPKEIFKYKDRYLQKILVWKIKDDIKSISKIISKVNEFNRRFAKK